MEIQIEKCGCGGEGILKGRKKRKVVCSKCGAQGPAKALASNSIYAWNQIVKKEKQDE